MKLSGCVIAKDEEKTIKKCLKSLLDICDEVIYVDTGSKDNTLAIAKEMGVKIYTYKWNNDFSAARNFTISKASGDWIVFLDADEYFKDSKRESYENIIKQAKKFDGIYVNIINLNDNGQVAFSNINTRIFKNSKAIRYKGVIHEDLVKNGKSLKILDGSKQLEIIHTGYTKETKNEKNKSERNINLLRQAEKNNPNNPLIPYYLSTEYSAKGEFQKQIDYAKQSIELGRIGDDTLDYLPYLSLIRGYVGLKEQIENDKDKKQKLRNIIRYYIEKFFKKFPDNPELNFFKGLINFEEYRYSESLNNFSQALDSNEKIESKTKMLDSGFKMMPEIYKYKGLIYSLMKDYETAVYMFTKSLQFNPNQSFVLKKLLKLLTEESETDTIRFLNKIYNLKDKDSIQMLIDASSDVNNRILIAYYQKKLTELVGKKEYSVFYLLLCGEYNKTLSYLLKNYEKDENLYYLLIVNIILKRDKNLYDKYKDNLTNESQKIVGCFLKESQELKQDNIKEYKIILDTLIRIDATKTTDSFLSLAEKFSCNLGLIIGDVFYKNNKYKEAIRYYQSALTHTVIDGEGYIKLGKAYYYNNDYENSFLNLLKAIESGEQNNEIFEYLIFQLDYLRNRDKLKLNKLLNNIDKTNYREIILDKISSSKKRTITSTHSNTTIGSNQSSPIFIGGAGRSGTTLLRVMLNAHPNLCAGPEFKMLQPLSGIYNQMISLKDIRQAYNLNKNDINQSFASFISSFFQKFKKDNSAKRIVEKTPHNVLIMKELVSIFPNAKFVNVIRDGRDVTSSLVTMNWRDFEGKPLPYVQNIEKATKYWSQVIVKSIQDSKHPLLKGRVKLIKYEDLIKNPEKVMKNVLDFLDEPWVEQVLSYNSIDRGYEPNESSTDQVSKGLYSKSIHRWKKDLTKDDKETFKEIAGKLLIDLGYENSLDW